MTFYEIYPLTLAGKRLSKETNCPWLLNLMASPLSL